MQGRAKVLAERSVADLVSLTGRTAVVTGASQGIGLATSRRLAQAGAGVALVDRDPSVHERAGQLATECDVLIKAYVADVTDELALESVAADVVAQFGSLEIWVNNAGIYPAAGLLETDLDTWSRTMGVNLTGAFLGARAAARQMLDAATVGAVIINVGSVSGLRGRSRLSAYSASKHGVTGLTRSLAVELGPSGIRVVGIAPSVVDTPGMQARRDSATVEEFEKLKHFEESLTEAIPLRRAAIPDDVARVVLFCAGDLAAMVSGVILPVDGGLTAG